MHSIFNTFRPDGFHSINGYLFVSNPEALINFLKQAFYAEEINRSMVSDSGDVGNVILQIGDACLMISQARGEFLDMRTAFYIYVNDVDEVYEHTLSLGGKSVFAPADMDYGDRQAGIKDLSGNYWWISKRLQKKNYHD